MCHARKERERLFGTRSADYIRASSHNGCIQRPNTWLHPNASLKCPTFPLHRGRRPYMALSDISLRCKPMSGLGATTDIGRRCALDGSAALNSKRTNRLSHRLDTVFALVRKSTSLEALAKTVFVATDFTVFSFCERRWEKRMHSRITLIAVVFSLVGTTTQDATAGGHGGNRSPHFLSTLKTSTNAVPRTNSLNS